MNQRKASFTPLPWLLCLCAAIAGCATTNPVSDRFKYADISKPEFFPILPWDPNNGWKTPFIPTKPDGLESIADCNFNMAGFVLPRDLPKCEKLGLGALVLPSEEAFTSFAYTRQWRDLSEQEIDRRVKAMVDSAGNSPAIVGYFIMDEPGVKDFPGLGKAVDAVKKYAPGKLAYVNLYPDYATIGAPDKSQLGTENYTDYLERFVAEVKPQVISYDNYMVEMSMDLTNQAKYTSYYRNLLEVRRVARKHNLPFLNIVTANQIRPFTTPPSPANLQFHAYTTLAAGYRGITWFTYYQRGYHYAPIDSTGRKTQTWAWLKEINRQVATLTPLMSRLSSTGVFFSAPAPVPNLPLLPGGLVEAVTCPSPLMIGEFKNPAGKGYVMVVNLSLQNSAKFNLKTAQPVKSLQIVSTIDGGLFPFDEKDGCWLTAGQGVLLALEP
jgi:hypothetical protein